MPEHDEVTPEEIAALGEQYLMTQYFRQQFQDVPAGERDFRAIGVGAGSAVVSLVPRVLGQGEVADKVLRFGSAARQAAAEMDRADWEAGKTIVPPVVRGGLRGAAETIPTMMVAGAAGGWPAAVGLASAQEANQAVTEGKAAGLKGSKLAGFVGSQAVAEAIPAVVMQKLGLGGLEKIVGQRGAQAAARGMLEGFKQTGAEVGEQLVTEGLHANVEKTFGTNPQALEPEALYERGLQTVVQTVAGMGVVQAPSIIQGAISRKRARQLGVPEDLVGRAADRNKWVQDHPEAINAGTTDTGAQGVVAPGAAGVGQALESGAGGLARGAMPPNAPGTSATSEAVAGQPEGLQEPVGATETPVPPATAPESPEGVGTQPEAAGAAEAAVRSIAEALPDMPERTGILNRVNDEIQQALGMEPIERQGVVGDQEIDAQAAAKMAAEPGWVPGLIAELRVKSRPHTTLEAAGLGRHQRDLVNRRVGIAGEMTQARSAGDAVRVAQLQTEAMGLDADIKTLHEATKWSGSEAGRAFRQRQILRDSDYSLSRMITDKIIEKGGEALTPEETTKIAEQAARITELETQITQMEEEAARSRATERTGRLIDEALESIDGKSWREHSVGSLRKRAESLGIPAGGRNRQILARKINEVEDVLRAEAERNEIPFRVFMEGIRQSFPAAQEVAAGRRRAKEIAEATTKLNAEKIAKLEDAYKDRSSVLGFDDVTQELLADPDVAPYLGQTWEDPGEQLWQLLREPPIPTRIRASSPELMNMAVAWVANNPDVTEDSLPSTGEVQAAFVGETPKTAPAGKATERAPSARSRRQAVQQKRKAAVEKFKATWASLGRIGAVYDPQSEAQKQIQLFKDAVEVVKTYAEEAYLSFAEFWSEMRSSVGSSLKVRAVFQQAWDEARQRGELAAPDIDMEKPSSISRVARQIERALVESGIRDRDAIVDMVHQELEGFIPGITKRDTMDALSGYGQYAELSKDEIDVLIREYHGELQQIAKLEDMSAGKPPAKTGVERRTPSDAERQLIAMVNEAKRRNPHLFVGDQANRLKGALEAAKTHLRNRIRDVRQEIETKERIVKDKTELAKDDEYKALHKELETLLEEHATIFEKPGKTEEQKAAAAIRAMERATKGIQERIKAGEIGPKGRPANRPDTKEVAAAREKLEAWRDVMDRLREIEHPKMTQDEREVQAYKKILEKRIGEYKERIAAGDFAPKKRSEKTYPPEIEKLQFELSELKKEIDKGREADKWAKMSNWRKSASWGMRIGHAVRSIWAGFDDSFFGRQGGAYVAMHPIQSLASLTPSFQAVRKIGYFRAQQQLEGRDNYALAKRAGLGLTSIDGPLTEQEEPFIGELSQHIPGVAMSERMYVAGLNRMRMDFFDSCIATLKWWGGPVTEAEAAVIANFVNISTGRGSLTGKWKTAATGLASVFFSPRYVASRFQLLLSEPFKAATGTGGHTARTRLLVASEYARMAASLGVFYALVSLARLLWPDDDKKHRPRVESDLRSSDFGKVRLGNTRIDPLFGMSQTIVLIGKTLTGTTKKQSGKLSPLRAQVIPFVTRKRKMELTQDTMLKVADRFVRSKLAPVWSLTGNLIFDETVIGERYSDKRLGFDFSGVVEGVSKGDLNRTTNALQNNLLWETFTPLSGRDVLDVLRDQGVPRGTALWMLSLFGLGLQTYERHSGSGTKAPIRKAETKP